MALTLISNIPATCYTSQLQKIVLSTTPEESAIDQLVYKLYDLNENEIKLIEKS